MNSGNWRPNQVGEPAMDAIDWRTQLQPDSRLRIVNKIMDAFKKHLSVSGQDGLHELKKITERFEEKNYTSATSQISTARTGHGHANVGDWQEEVYHKIKAMKELYLPEINVIYQNFAPKSQQLESLPHQPKSGQYEKLKVIFDHVGACYNILTGSKK